VTDAFFQKQYRLFRPGNIEFHGVEIIGFDNGFRIFFAGKVAA
jgi:hypothetical protein